MRSLYVPACCAALSTALLGPTSSAIAGAAEPPPPTALTITVEPGARQTFAGFGTSIFPWTPASVYKTQVTPAQTTQMAQLLWRDAHFRSVRLWMHPGEEPVSYYVDGYVGTGKLPAAIAAGARDLILAPDHIPPAMHDGKGYIKDADIPRYAVIIADFIRDFKQQSGILINYAGLLNEPNDRPVKFADAQWPVMIRALRSALDQHGLQSVGIVAPESANCGADAYSVVDALKSDPQAWRVLDGVATHSYNNAATEDMAKRAIGKAYWITEAGGTFDGDEVASDALQAASVSARFLNDVNHRVTHWQFFIGAEQADPHGNTGRILKYDNAPFHLTILQKYYYFQQLSDAFDIGAVFRHSLSSRDGEMTYTYGKKPPVNAAAARNPDGSWSIGLTNFTASSFRDADDPQNFDLHNSGYAAKRFTVTLRVPELAHVKTLRFTMRRSNGGVNNAAAGTLLMHNGEIIVPNLASLDLITLRSNPVTDKRGATR